MYLTKFGRRIQNAGPKFGGNAKEINKKLQKQLENKKKVFNIHFVADDYEETDDAYKMFFRMAGFQKNDIEVTTDSKSVYIEATSNRWGSYTNEFNLPPEASGDDIRASMTNGVLEITIPKESPDNKQINIE